MQLTNAARQLKQRNVPFTYHTYEVDESDVSAKHVAASLGKPLDQLYKTICLENEQRRFAFFLISGELDIDLKAAAGAGSRRLVRRNDSLCFFTTAPNKKTRLSSRPENAAINWNSLRLTCSDSRTVAGSLNNKDGGNTYVERTNPLVDS